MVFGLFFDFRQSSVGSDIDTRLFAVRFARLFRFLFCRERIPVQAGFPEERLQHIEETGQYEGDNEGGNQSAACE